MTPGNLFHKGQPRPTSSGQAWQVHGPDPLINKL